MRALLVLVVLAGAAPAHADCVKVKKGTKLRRGEEVVGKTTRAVVMRVATSGMGEMSVDTELQRTIDDQRVVVAGLDSVDIDAKRTSPADCPPRWDIGADQAADHGVDLVTVRTRQGKELGLVDRSLIAKQLAKGRKRRKVETCFHLRVFRGIDVEACASTGYSDPDADLSGLGIND